LQSARFQAKKKSKKINDTRGNRRATRKVNRWLEHHKYGAKFGIMGSAVVGKRSNPPRGDRGRRLVTKWGGEFELQLTEKLRGNRSIYNNH